MNNSIHPFIKRKMKLKSFCIAFAAIPFLSVSCENRNNQKEVTDLAMADSLLTNVLSLYHVEKYDLLSETYPINPETQVTYLAEGSEQKKGQEVSFLWPYSGMI